MLKTFNKWLNHPFYFRYGYFALLICSILLNRLDLSINGNFYLLYIIAVIFMGIGFFEKTILVIILTFITVVCRFFLLPDSDPHMVTFLIQFITYLLIAFISIGLMQNVQKVREDQLELTTALANALDTRDTYTMHHSENTAKYAVKIAMKMKLSQDLCNEIRIGGLLHDIGKIGIPEHILTKRGKLTKDEYELIKEHPKIGYEMINHVKGFHQSGVLDIVLFHHERFDGKGYPMGLKGDKIPLAARIVAIADVFDAMTTRRVYRQELDLEYTLNEIHKNKGTQFDPEIVDIFLSLFESGEEVELEKPFLKNDSV